MPLPILLLFQIFNIKTDTSDSTSKFYNDPPSPPRKPPPAPIDLQLHRSTFGLCVMALSWRNETYIMHIKVYIQLSDVSGRRQRDVTRRRRRSVRTDGRIDTAAPPPLSPSSTTSCIRNSEITRIFEGRDLVARAFETGKCTQVLVSGRKISIYC